MTSFCLLLFTGFMNKQFNQLPQDIHNMLDIFFETGEDEFKKLIVLDKSKYFDFVFTIKGQVDPSDHRIDNSFDKYISRELNIFINDTLNVTKRKAEKTIVFNYNQGSAYQIHILIKTKNPKNVYSIQFNEHDSEYYNESSRIIEKVYKIIAITGEAGLSKTKLFDRTRFLTKSERENILTDLIASGRIRAVNTGKYKPKITYYTVI